MYLLNFKCTVHGCAMEIDEYTKLQSTTAVLYLGQECEEFLELVLLFYANKLPHLPSFCVPKRNVLVRRYWMGTYLYRYYCSTKFSIVILVLFIVPLRNLVLTTVHLVLIYVIFY